MDFIDELEDLEAKTNASGGPSGGSSDVSKSVPVTPPQTPVLGRKQAKVPSSVGGKQGAGVVKKPAVPRTAKPKAQAQTKAKLEKALTSSASKNSKSKSRSSTPPTTANVLRASNVATVMTDNLGSGLDMTPHAPIFALTHTPSYAQESSYSMPMPPPALGPPFGHVDTFDADTTHLDSSNISNINNFLDFPPIDSSSSTNDYPSLMAPPTTPMTSFQLGNGHVNMQGAGGGGGGAGMEFSGDVGLRILDQLQTLNTTMSGMYEMMRRQVCFCGSLPSISCADMRSRLAADGAWMERGVSEVLISVAQDFQQC